MADTVTFISKDNKKSVYPINVGIMSNLVKNIIEDCKTDDNSEIIIPITNMWYDDIQTIFNFLESTENTLELNTHSLSVFSNQCLPMMIGYVNFLDIEPLLNLLTSIFAYRLEYNYNNIKIETDSISEIKFALFWKLPSEMILYCLSKIKTHILFKLCMLYNSFWHFMRSIPVKHFSFIDCNPKDVSEFLNYITQLNDENITTFVIDIFSTGLSDNIENETLNESRGLFLNFIMNNQKFLESINFNSSNKDYNQLVISLFNINNPDKFEKLCKSTFNEDEEDEFNFNLFCSIILENEDKTILKTIKKYIEMKENNFNGFSENVNYQTLCDCALITGNYDVCLFAIENGAEYTDYDITDINGYTFADPPGSISYAIIGLNFDCIKYVIDQYKNNNDRSNFERDWKYYMKWVASFSTIEILTYIINNVDGIIETFDNLYDYILEWAVINGNIELCQYALDNNAVFTDDMNTRMIEYNKNRPERAYADGDDIDFEYFSESLTSKMKDSIEKCMTIIHNHTV